MENEEQKIKSDTKDFNQAIQQNNESKTLSLKRSLTQISRYICSKCDKHPVLSDVVRGFFTINY